MIPAILAVDSGSSTVKAAMVDHRLSCLVNEFVLHFSVGRAPDLAFLDCPTPRRLMTRLYDGCIWALRNFDGKWILIGDSGFDSVNEILWRMVMSLCDFYETFIYELNDIAKQARLAGHTFSCDRETNLYLR